MAHNIHFAINKCFLILIFISADPTIVDSTGTYVTDYYFPDSTPNVTLTCKITAADGEYILAWFDDGM